MELIINIITGAFNNYAEVKSPRGYCFYDADAENKQHMTSIFTPITNETILKNKFVIVQGDADTLNEELYQEVANDE